MAECKALIKLYAQCHVCISVGAYMAAGQSESTPRMIYYNILTLQSIAALIIPVKIMQKRLKDSLTHLRYYGNCPLSVGSILINVKLSPSQLLCRFFAFVVTNEVHVGEF